jgi:GT2 family glycosyltransferase
MPYASDANKIWACGGYIKRSKLAIGGLQPRSENPYQVDYLPGAAILCRSEIWNDIGGFSENYFLAFEEAELALEIKRRGFQIVVDPRALVLHRVGMSSQIRIEYVYNALRNPLIFARYLYGPCVGLLYGVLITAVSTVRAGIPEKLNTRLRLWAKAVFDEITRAPLNRPVLNSIALRYGKR